MSLASGALGRRFFLLLCMALGSGLGVDPAKASEPEISVVIDGGAPRAFSRSALQALPQQEVELTVRGGAIERWRGVPVTELLKASGLDLSSNLGGGFVSRRVLAARAADGYVAAFGLAELDPRFGRRVPLVAWQAPDGAALAPHRGPFILVAPEDARASRGVRQLHSLNVMPLP